MINFKKIILGLVLASNVTGGSEFDGLSPLMIASRCGHLAAVVTLVENGAEVDKRASTGHTALVYASESGSLDIVKRLVENGADIDGPVNPLYAATENGRLDVVKFLLEEGGLASESVHVKILSIALVCGHMHFIKHLLNFVNFDYKTWQKMLMSTSHIDALKFLIDGFDFELSSYDAGEILTLAILNGDRDSVKYICDKGAKIAQDMLLLCLCVLRDDEKFILKYAIENASNRDEVPAMLDALGIKPQE
ncbi:MAG: ankyrin repeat domain-containing protein [Alphaproteobacteria bacterium]|nr:MAG: ankyrin repeat domain-containing protein [Alphaproteobacteria bacterium]